MELENLSSYTSDSLAEGYFGADEFSNEAKVKLKRYEHLVNKIGLTDTERAERAKLKIELKKSKYMSGNIWRMRIKKI